MKFLIYLPLCIRMNDSDIEQKDANMKHGIRSFQLLYVAGTTFYQPNQHISPRAFFQASVANGKKVMS